MLDHKTSGTVLNRALRILDSFPNDFVETDNWKLLLLKVNDAKWARIENHQTPAFPKVSAYGNGFNHEKNLL